ncbi:TPA: hypothetical protein ACWZQP_001619, partial [Streptococcus agalactiae]
KTPLFSDFLIKCGNDQFIISTLTIIVKDYPRYYKKPLKYFKVLFIDAYVGTTCCELVIW